ncbi:MAG: LarC family nickel insertion protein [Eubacterium sp.]|nr:LarC family nickel insertion protein [Eubacterium sp.]
MGKKLYIECNTGISGDMSVASLLDLGADKDKLMKVLDSLKETVGGFDINITKVSKAGIMATDFDVVLGEDNHDHDMGYLYGHDEHHEHHHDHDHEHHHEQDNEHEQSHEHHHHDHEHEHSHEHHLHDHHHDHHHIHRSLSDVIAIINSADMTDGAREIATNVFTLVAKAESEVHGRSIEEVHFHEVGAIDSIVDIISAAVCLDDITTKYDIDDIIITHLVDGTGTVRCQHGILSIPVPAVLKIAELTGIKLSITNRKGEYVTPTGAAFAATVKTTDKLPESFSIIKTGLGAGKREHEVPGILRSMIIE